MGMYKVADDVINDKILGNLQGALSKMSSSVSRMADSATESAENAEKQALESKRTYNNQHTVNKNNHAVTTAQVAPSREATTSGLSSAASSMIMRDIADGQVEQALESKRFYNENRRLLTNIRDEIEEVVDMLAEGIVISGMNEDAFENLVKQLKHTTFKVKMIDAYTDITEPVINAIGGSADYSTSVQRELFERSNKHLKAIENYTRLSYANKAGDKSGNLLIQLHRFLSGPIWFRLAKGITELSKFTAKSAWSILFGRTKKETTEQKILKAIKEQTEFQMTGQIDRQKSLFQKVLGQGLVGGIGRQILKLGDIDRETAQRREQQRALGQTENLIGGKGIRGFLTDLIYKDDIIKKGRQGGILPSSTEATSKDPLQVIVERILPEGLPAYIDNQELLELTLEQNLQLGLLTKMFSGNFSYEYAHRRLKTHAYAEIGRQSIISQGILESSVIAEQEAKRTSNVTSNMVKELKSVNKNTALSVREQKRTRRQMMFAAIGNAILSAGGTIVGAVTSMAGSLLGILGTIAAALSGGKLLSKAGGLFRRGGKDAAKTTGKKTAGKTAAKSLGKAALKKIPIIGAVAGLGFGAARALSGDWAGAGMEVASGVASTVPGIGTAASVGIDATLAARDMKGDVGASRIEDKERGEITKELLAAHMRGEVTSEQAIEIFRSNQLGDSEDLQKFVTGLTVRESAKGMYSRYSTTKNTKDIARDYYKQYQVAQNTRKTTELLEGKMTDKEYSQYLRHQKGVQAYEVQTQQEQNRAIPRPETSTSIDIPDTTPELQSIHRVLTSLLEVTEKGLKQTPVPDFPIGHDSLTLQNVYGAN